MATTGIADDVTRRTYYLNAVRRLREARVVLPTFAQLTEPSRIPAREAFGRIAWRGFWRVGRLERFRLEDSGAKILFPAPV